ncbi:hypothetical protein AGABI2DRAFT_150171 [Agaricus bisporus var. bisporus H97]|uniref:hypothetical protein n=1 Tax=Agaricus bisporus var. bisporus (strain H97 / ATCC MYA-4626 / FGSC 10389) TaxID=936046 RepID=UPI00029F7919|nr:hypothetical protein AGABI2DRAFT_150171 [Agaricus bisporus var. bisporus H97]EKV48342.1 hypothetical protein AGABI2DRAFT_150171 [Agaricus bisporus var. bisporus H97]
MFLSLTVTSLLSLVSLCIAQLPLPVPPYLPPNASFGTIQSPSGRPNSQWTNLLGGLLYFYEAQRSGQLPSETRVSWRNSSCLDDGKDVGLDLSGGYYDAGDYIKATFPLSFTLMSICWGATDFGQGYDLANQTAYLDSMLRWGLDWLIKAHPNDNTLYVLVGNPTDDDDYWGGDLNIPTPRTSFRVDAAHPGTDVVAGTAAAFAACSNLYRNKGFKNAPSGPAGLSNTSYADTLLAHAKSLYSFAVSATGGQRLYQESVPAVGRSYGSSDYGDELAIAALFLSWATDSQDLFNQAASYWTQYHLDDEEGVFNWDSKSAGIPILFTQVLQSTTSVSGNIADWHSKAEDYLDKIVQRRSSGMMTKGGLLYYNGDSDEASLNPAMNAAMLLTRYAPYASSPDKRNSYLKFAQSQVDYALGKNPMSAPYVIGINPNSPSNPHSAMASGGSNIGAIDTDPVKTTYVLYGAVIGGPDVHDNYFDIRSDWPETEIALDYNAPFLTLAAYNVMQATADPFYTNLQEGAYAKVKPTGQPCDAAIQTGCSRQRLSHGARIAISVVLAVVILATVGLIGYCIFWPKRKKVAY